MINKYKAEVKKKSEKEALEKAQKLQMVETLQTITLTIHKKVRREWLFIWSDH